LALSGAFLDVSAQWEPLGAPGTFSVSFLVEHKDKAYGGVERSLFSGEREGADLVVFRPADPAASGLTTGLSWGDDFVTGSNQGRVVVYSDVSLAQRRVEARPTIQAITALAALGNVLLVGSWEGVHRSDDTLASAVLASATAGFKGVNRLEVFDAKVYAATDSGLFVSRDTGLSWSKVPTPRRKIDDVALFHDTLYLGTEAGLYRSADSGSTWLAPLWTADRFPRLAVRDDRLFAMTQTDLRRKDPDAPWSQVRLGLAGQYLDVLSLGRTEWIASYWGVAVSESGTPWTLARTSFTPASPNVQALAQDGDVLLAGSDIRGTFVSTDRGRTWTMRSHPFHYGGVYGVLANAMHDGIWYSATRQGIHRSADSGLSWDLSNGGLPDAEFSAYGFHPQGTRLWLCTDKGLYFTDDGGLTWAQPPGRPAGASVYDLVASRDSTLFAATDTGLQKARPPYDTWTPAGLAMGGYARVAGRGDTLYAWGSTPSPVRSRDGGLSWQPLASGLAGSSVQRILPGTHHAMATNGVGQVFVIGHADTAWQSFQGNLPETGVGAQVLVDDTVYLWSSFNRFVRRALPASPTSIGDAARRIPSPAGFSWDARDAALRLDHPASVEAVLVRDLAGRTRLEAPARTGWLSLARLPAGLYTVVVRFRDRAPATGTVLRR